MVVALSIRTLTVAMLTLPPRRSQACVKGLHPPKRVFSAPRSPREHAVAADTPSVAEQTYSEESRDDVIKSSRDSPPKAKQATVLETWLQVGAYLQAPFRTLASLLQ